MTPQEIKQLREKVLKISTTELAQLCGVKSRRTVEQWETEIGKRGHQSPGGSSLKILLDLQAEHASRKRYDQYNVVKRIIWIRDQLLDGQMFNSTDVGQLNLVHPFGPPTETCILFATSSSPAR